ncbi:MAG: hypothetical protein IPO21_20515 [Bacteroidales bacterium]|nr:hypothetical protein [Bacteroidales bacterium]
MQFKVVQVPIIEAKENSTNEIHHLSFDNNNLISRSVLEFDGNAKYFFITYLNRYTLSEQSLFLSKKLSVGSNKFKLDSFSIASAIDRDSLFILKYEFSLPDYAKKIDDEYYINLNLNRDFELDRIDTSKVEFAIMNDYLFEKNTKVILDIPLGFSLKNIPTNNSFKHKDFGFELRYEVNESNKQIILVKNIYINNLTIEQSSFEEWNKMIDLIKTSYKQTVILKKI